MILTLIFADMSRFTKMIEYFIDKNEFAIAWSKFQIDFTHTYEVNDISNTSTLDHFIWSKNIEGNIIEAGVLHLPINLSDHCPIFCHLKVGELKKLSMKPNTLDHKPVWEKASDEQKQKFYKTLENGLEKVKVERCLMNCQNVHCNESSHMLASDDLIVNILETIDQTYSSCLSSMSTKKKGKDTPIASWASEVEPFKKDAYFWHAVWMSAGRPLNTTLHRIMKRTRNVYHLQIRKCKYMANILKKNTLLNACVNGKGDIFTEIRKLRRSSPTVVNAIDGVTEDLPNHFAKIYNTLYNSVNDTDSLSSLYQSINEKTCVAGRY